MKKDEVILSFLRKAGGAFVSGQALSKDLKISRSAVWKEVVSLRRLGYKIKALPRAGYRLDSAPDKLFAHELVYELGTRFIGQNIQAYDAIDSTNDAAFHLGEQGVAEGACVFAENQKKGRGRLGRSWVSPKGKGLLVSVLLRPLLPPAEVSKITLMAAVSVVKAIRHITGKEFGIKWPNDVLYGGRKVCGILTELSAEIDRVNFVVLGIGINVNAVAGELPPGATSLREVLGRKISRVALAQRLLRQIEDDYLRFKGGAFKALAEEWEEYSVTSGRRVTARVMGRVLQGQATGIDQDGALWIRKDNGLQERLLAGDVEHLR